MGLFDFLEYFCCDRKYREKFISACEKGDILTAKKIISRHKNLEDLDMDLCLKLAVTKGQESMARYLLECGAKNLDECLKIAVQNNRCNLAELLVEKGAKPVVGLRVSKSINITKMLYRYENGSRNNII